MSIPRYLRLIAVLTATTVALQVAHAGGLLGDIINKVVPGAGTALDNAHRQIKDAIPPYKAVEEGASKVVNETVVQSSAPLLQELIARSRDDAIRNGVRPIPDLIRNVPQHACL